MTTKEPPRPNEVLVVGRPWTVEWLDEYAWNELGPRGDGASGITDQTSYEIFIRTFEGRTDGSKARVTVIQDTLMHEMIHAMCQLTPAHKMLESRELTLLNQSQHNGKGLEEWLADNFSVPLIHLVRDNPVAFKWMTWKETS